MLEAVVLGNSKSTWNEVTIEALKNDLQPETFNFITITPELVHINGQAFYMGYAKRNYSIEERQLAEAAGEAIYDEVLVIGKA